MVLTCWLRAQKGARYSSGSYEVSTCALDVSFVGDGPVAILGILAVAAGYVDGLTPLMGRKFGVWNARQGRPARDTATSERLIARRPDCEAGDRTMKAYNTFAAIKNSFEKTVEGRSSRLYLTASL